LVGLSKYPPAKPGALELEPLEAADGGADTTPRLEPPKGGDLSAKVERVETRPSADFEREQPRARKEAAK
jgi:hypothetical protein